ncbi:hypothetical protein [Stenotrophomonas sp.]|uniref:hypothetical protein n=1 Tax=Stenotrophomonas sp. TaxID=69392 RepID=UPI0028AB2726|nr:hypothetical protein [Stenotrophomonas sp.]
MRHPHRHRSFAPAMRGQRPALATVLAWLGLLSMLFATLPVLEQHVPGSTALVLQLPAEERPAGEGSPREESPAKPRRLASARPAAPRDAEPRLPVSLDALMATLVDLPPQVAPSIDSAPATPLPAAPGLRVQRGQAPPQG